MTLIRQAHVNETERQKWRINAERAAKHLKSVTDWGGRETFNPAFVFDDAIVNLPLNVALIEKLNEKALADWIFDTVLEAQRTAAPQDVAPADGQPQADPNPRPDLAGSAADQPHPAVAAAGEKCSCKVPPDWVEPCTNDAVAGLRVNLYAKPAIQKRYGKKVLLSLIFDLPVCATCFPNASAFNVMNDEQWKAFSKVAQQRNNGILADREQTEIVRCEFDDPEYVALRKQIAAANDSQPGPSGAST